jgi:hypothetical protein
MASTDNVREVLASSVGDDAGREITFKVSDVFLDEFFESGDWSEPVRFRFECRDGQWDLVMSRVEKTGG